MSKNIKHENILSDFFRINLPYGIAKNKKNQWMAFNREYLPLGYTDWDLKGTPGESYLDLPVYTKYKGIKEELLLELAEKDNAFELNEEGDICTVYLYSDSTNPMNQSDDNPELWKKYFDKLKRLSELEAV